MQVRPGDLWVHDHFDETGKTLGKRFAFVLGCVVGSAFGDWQIHFITPDAVKGWYQAESGFVRDNVLVARIGSD